MKKLIVLTKSIFINSLRSEGKKINNNGFLGMVVASLIFGIIFISMTLFIGPIFVENGLEAEFLTMLMLASQVLVLLMGSALLINVMFFSKDAEFLLSLPIKPRHLFLAKFIYVYVSELTISAFLMVMSGVAFGIIAGFGVINFLFLAVVIFLVPLLPLMFAAILSLPAMLLISLFKGKTLITTLFFIALFGTGMYFYMSFIGNAQNADIDLPLQSLQNTFATLYPNISMARIVVHGTNLSLSDVLITLGSTAGLALIAYGLASVAYARGMSSQLEESRSKKTQSVEFTQGTAFKAFINKEFREIFRSPGLGFYCLFQAVLAPVLLVFYGNMGQTIDGADMLAGEFGAAMGFFFVTLMVCGMNYTALSSVSREGKNFNMSKTLPAPYSYQMAAKIRVADIVMAGSLIISSLTLIFLVRANIIQVIVFFGFSLILGNAINYFLAYKDAKSPKLEWESITVALKDNKSALLSMLLCTALAVPLLVAYLVIALSTDGILQIVLFAVMWSVLYGAAFFLNYLFRKRMRENIDSVIANLET